MQRALKRGIDIAVSAAGLVVLSPLLLLIALLVKCTSQGSVFFRQQRLGRHGALFTIWKFRTMVDGRAADCERLTKVGYWLRRTSLDELPQLWNVLIGDMSLIGPRPPLPTWPYTYAQYSDVHKMRFLVRPGMSGLAQVMVRNAAVWDEKLAFDVLYVAHFSLWLDVQIVLRTMVVVALQRGIEEEWK